MTEGSVDRLRAHASRGDYPSMARLATALYARGLRPREVLLECYEVDLPEEFFVILPRRLTRPRLLPRFTNQPWELGVPPSKGGPSPSSVELTGAAERNAFVRDPDLVPLVHVITPGTALEDMVVCYRLTELRAGSTAVFSIKETAGPDEEIERCGDSLLAVLHAHHHEYLRQLERTLDQPWNWGFGAVDRKTVDEVRSLVERVEGWQREVAAAQEDD